MSGKYLRKRVPGGMPDPTMTHVDDPHVFHVGQYIIGHYGIYLITAIDDAVFNNPDIRFAHIQNVRGVPEGGIVHDVRKDEAETFRLTGFVEVDGAWARAQDVLSHEEAYAAMQKSGRGNYA